MLSFYEGEVRPGLDVYAAGAPTDIDGADSPTIMAAPDLDDFLTTWNTPGMEFLGTSALEPGYEEELLDEFDLSDECTSAGREDYTTGSTPVGEL